MPGLPTATSTALLQGLKQADATVWVDFTARYRPIVVAYARRLGLRPGDAEDVAQETLGAFAQAYREGRYERDRGRLRAWLFGIASNTLRDHCRRGQRRARVAGAPPPTGFLENLPDERTQVDAWDEEWREAVLRQALARVKGEVQAGTFEAFRLFAVEQQPAAQVAARLSITENAVFCAKQRVLRRLRELLADLEDSF